MVRLITPSFLTLYCFVLFSLAGCSESSPDIGQAFAPLRQSPGQVAGSEACASCHASQVRDWSQSGMARTLESTDVGELDGFLDVPDPVSGYLYRFARTPDGQSHVLGELRPSQPEHAVAAEVLFAIGSGTMDRSYVLGHGAGMWFAPLEVLSRPEGRLAVLAPHADMHPGSRFSIPITGECLGCHTDNLPPRSFPLNLRPDPEVWTPRGISCAACHRGTQAHAVWQEQEGTGGLAEGPDPLLMHGELDRYQQLSICAACHLQGDARLVLGGPALGPPEPGGDLLQARALFVAAEESSELGFVSQVERLVGSKCFLGSEMTCSTCHDPHKSLSAEGERERVRGACLQCHATGASSSHPEDGMRQCSVEPEAHLGMDSAQDCVSCHMPLSGVFDVARVQIHDHNIRKDGSNAPGPQVSSKLRSLASPAAKWKRFAWPGVGLPEHYDEAGLWMMAYVGAGQIAQGAKLVDVEAGPTALGLGMYHHVRAGLLQGLGRLEEARDAYVQALAVDPDLAESAINLGLVLGELGQDRAGVELLSQVLERYPLAWGALRNRAVLNGRLGDLEGARADLQRAFQALPSAEVALGLVAICKALGDRLGAASWERMGRELNPSTR